MEDTDLPPITSPVRLDSGILEPSEHAASLFSSNGRPWVTLSLVSNAPAGSKVPVYFSGDTVHGSAEIVLDGPHKIHSVVAEVWGEVGMRDGAEVRDEFGSSSFGEFLPPWKERKVLWDSKGGFEPKSIASAGTWKWDFSFPIPRHFDDSKSGGSVTAETPGSVSLKSYAVYVEYRVLLLVKRGKWMPTVSELRSVFVYSVRERAPPPSPLRAIAYTEQEPPPGPSVDSDGWQTCKALDAKGVVFGNREVDLVCQPYLSTPTIYPRGGTIFYRIEVSGYDPQALQLLSSPSAFTVLLTREVACAPRGSNSLAATGKSGLGIGVDVIARGISWSAEPPEPTEGVRILEGEINIPPNAEPNISIAVLQLRYSVTFAVDVAGFAPRDRSALTTKYPVRIVSHPALGVTPVSRIPPGYDSKVAQNKTDTKWAYLAIKTEM
ncbi:hypothetical protein BDV93DRAFT_520706 [Ceratobasidium sp. AG-I]|nr:hypothetical protein BDV93DRAFT_520706 [Ceratobasidium sp. AG-I]